MADFGIAELGKPHDRPFFLTIGFHKPHMPWNVPEKYFLMHPLDEIELPPTTPDDLGDIPAAGVKMAKPDGDHAAMLASGRWKEAVQPYLATITYLDAQIGRVLDAYEKSPHRDNTIICLWGDHGWHLGEKEHWRKFALWEESHPRAVHLGGPRHHPARRRLHAAGRFHEHLSHAVRADRRRETRVGGRA
ncbi:MAG: sulfatase-like hydrolase/transferase [Verrucomicrobiales bacterium]